MAGSREISEGVGGRHKYLSTYLIQIRGPKVGPGQVGTSITARNPVRYVEKVRYIHAGGAIPIGYPTDSQGEPRRAPIKLRHADGARTTAWGVLQDRW